MTGKNLSSKPARKTEVGIQTTQNGRGAMARVDIFNDRLFVDNRNRQESLIQPASARGSDRQIDVSAKGAKNFDLAQLILVNCATSPKNLSDLVSDG